MFHGALLLLTFSKYIFNEINQIESINSYWVPSIYKEWWMKPQKHSLSWKYWASAFDRHTYTPDNGLLIETKFAMCPLLAINAYKMVLWAWNTESYAWLFFKYIVSIVKLHTQQTTVPFQVFGVSHLKIIPYSSFLLIPVRCAGHCLPH